MDLSCRILYLEMLWADDEDWAAGRFWAHYDVDDDFNEDEVEGVLLDFDVDSLSFACSWLVEHYEFPNYYFYYWCFLYIYLLAGQGGLPCGGY